MVLHGILRTSSSRVFKNKFYTEQAVFSLENEGAAFLYKNTSLNLCIFNKNDFFFRKILTFL